MSFPSQPSAAGGPLQALQSAMRPASAAPAKLAEFVDAALQVLPPGTHVAAPELLWQANQSGGGRLGGGSMQGVVHAWLAAARNPAQNSTPNAGQD
jgi:hypothetical protein